MKRESNTNIHRAIRELLEKYKSQTNQTTMDNLEKCLPNASTLDLVNMITQQEIVVDDCIHCAHMKSEMYDDVKDTTSGIYFAFEDYRALVNELLKRK